MLIVEDDEDTRELYAWSLRAAGWLVHWASNGAQALLDAPLVDPDVIVMDLRLPILDGLEAIRQLKRDAATKHIPIVACTASERQTSEIDARKAGCDAFLSKPCEPDVLRIVLERLARTGDSSP